MGKVKSQISMSLDGFITGPDDSVAEPMGIGGERLHEWIFGLKSWREPHGLEGGETNQDSEVLEESIRNTGAHIVGRRMFDHAQGWGDNPPFRMPVFVVTHRSQEPLVKEGGTTFTFVTEGVESAVAQARAAAGDKDVTVCGGASIIQQLIKAGLLDEIEIHVIPVLMGAGTRLFDNLGTDQPEVVNDRALYSPGVTHLRYRFTTSP
jgi:dihydrofolate reductase